MADVVVVENPALACSECGFPLSKGKDVLAAVLYPDGWREVTHRSKRCRKSECARRNLHVWYNYVSQGRNHHAFQWSSENVMEFWFLTSRWGVTVAWLVQMSRRLVQLGVMPLT